MEELEEQQGIGKKKEKKEEEESIFLNCQRRPKIVFFMGQSSMDKAARDLSKILHKRAGKKPKLTARARRIVHGN
jgi:hypothetical protein